MWAYVRYVNLPKATNYLLMILFFILGLMSKPMLVTLPFVLLLLDYWPLGRIKYKNTKSNATNNTADLSSRFGVISRLVLEKVPLFILSAVSSTITFTVQKSGGAVMPTAMVPVKLRFSNAFISYLTYIEKMFWPSRLAVFYPYPVWKLTVWSGVVPLLILLAIPNSALSLLI